MAEPAPEGRAGAPAGAANEPVPTPAPVLAAGPGDPVPAAPGASLPKPPRATGRVQAEPLAVAPSLVGAPLATPGRRAMALLVDLAVLGVLSQATSWALVVALGVLALLVHHALAADGVRPWLARGVAGVLLLVALAVAWSALRPPAGNAWNAEVDEAVEAAEAALAASEAAEATAAVREATAAIPASTPGLALLQSLPARAASAAAAAAPSTEAELKRLVERLERLEREHRPPSLSERLDAAVAELGLGFGWGIVYFSLLPALWPGRTVGKALLKLRIADLSGRPITPLRALKRYGGYAAGIATGGLGFVQALWDPNRQCLHDKAAHTVVLDTRTP